MASENIINRVDFSKEIGIKDDVVKAVFEGLVNTLAKPDIDGGLVGGASLKADFGKIVNY